MIRSLAILVGLVTVNVAVGQAWLFGIKSYDDLRTWGWVTEKWDGNDKPYKEIMDAIQKQVKEGKNLGSIYDTYQSKARQNPKSAGAQFARGYYTLSMVKTKSIDFNKRRTSSKSELLIAWNGLVKVPSPRSKSYSRLRFLIEVRESPDFKLLPMGERLLRTDPSDLEVKYRYTSLLKNSPKQSDNEKALVLAKELLASDPKSEFYHFMIGECYASLMFSTKKKSYGDLAIQSYQKSLQLQKDSDQIRWTKHIIEATRRSMAKL